MNPERLLNRFLRYVQIDTTACEAAAAYPSSPGQLDLGRLLVEELRAIGVADAQQDAFGIVLATIPASRAEAPAIAFCAHLDTSPETCGGGVKPQVVRDYPGRDLVLPGNRQQVIRVAENAELSLLKGRTIITSDGTTLLGADDKAGVAVIMEAAARLMETPCLPHGPVRLCFTCDEEIGRGVDHIDPQRLAATVCYTLDGPGADAIDVETFSADLATVRVRGVNIHPSIAKGKMVNAIRVAADFLARLPRDRLAPESTEGREGFLHPYRMQGGVEQIDLRVLLRDFDAEQLGAQAQFLREAAAATMAAFPGSTIEIALQSQYRNMAAGLDREPRAVSYAEEALRRLGRSPRWSIIRGGTDGSRLTELGLATPNLSTGQHNPHSPQEWACLEQMEQAVAWLLVICGVWAEDSGVACESGKSG